MNLRPGQPVAALVGGQWLDATLLHRRVRKPGWIVLVADGRGYPADEVRPR